MNPLTRLHAQGQSFWLDYISRDLITSGELKRLVREDGVRGVTSNPSIFQKAISSGTAYDLAIRQLAHKGKTREEIFEALAVEDVRRAADVLRPVFDESGGEDGYVSLEVSPLLANDTEGTLVEAKRLFKALARPNVMIKIPATTQGIPAIEEAIFAGINVNVTLLFSVDSYRRVVEAYVSGLERRLRKGLKVDRIASVASFFVSRVDTIVDQDLTAMTGPAAAGAHAVLHKAAVANARIAYAAFEEAVATPRFAKLKAKGARPQRLLWASTGTKDKNMSDVVYVEELIGPYTVNTIPPQTVDAFRDHGRVAPRLTEGLAQARADWKAVTALGVDTDRALAQLLDDGVRAFVDAYTDLLRVVGAKREMFTGGHDRNQVLSLGDAIGNFEETFKALEGRHPVRRIWAKDAAFWKDDRSHQEIIRNSLGWLIAPDTVGAALPALRRVAADVRRRGFTHALLLGMGGSSLCPEVLRLTFGRKAGFPDFAILDSTEPGSVLERARRGKPEKTLFILASKSGTTTEPNAFFAYFFDLVKRKKGERAGENFIAITDPGTHLERLAREKRFAHIQLNPPDIGGRYSALSFFGMLPAAVMGLDVGKLLARAQSVADACAPVMPLDKNPGFLLGVALGTLARAGRDKVTFVLSKEISSFGTWVEQLIAESTGKEGRGIVPIESEPLGVPATYGPDRVFVAMGVGRPADTRSEKTLRALEKAGHPVIRIRLADRFDIAGEFVRWSFATAVAGKVLDINPFDQPNVQEAKDLTKTLLARYRKDGAFPKDEVAAREDGIVVTTADPKQRFSGLDEAVSHLVASVKAGDYVALLAYITRNPENDRRLAGVRRAAATATQVATTVGFGPRFLHSTGQLHKGGANNGVFVSITADDGTDAPVPGEAYSFGILKEAQARGDWGALLAKGRRALHLHLHDLPGGLRRLEGAFRRAAKA